MINGYRPHQARETLILMLEEQLERVRGETKGIGEAVGRAREVVGRLGKEGAGVVDDDSIGKNVENRKSRGEWEDRRIWKILEKEAGGF